MFSHVFLRFLSLPLWVQLYLFILFEMDEVNEFELWSCIFRNVVWRVNAQWEGMSEQDKFPLRQGQPSLKGTLPASVFVFQLLFVTLSALFRNSRLLGGKNSKNETSDTLRWGRYEGVSTGWTLLVFMSICPYIRKYDHVYWWKKKIGLLIKVKCASHWIEMSISTSMGHLGKINVIQLLR